MPSAVTNYEHFRLVQVIDKQHVEDQFSQPWHSFDFVSKQTEIGQRQSGEIVKAPFDAFIVFPNSNAAAGQEWFYLAQQVHKSKANTRL